MKKLTIILFIVLIVAAGVGFFAYARMAKQGGAASTEQTPTASGQPATSGFAGTTSQSVLPSPVPTVAQITLAITSPANGSTVTNPNLVLQGVTLPKADVFVNDSEVMADAKGNFTIQVALDEGDNTIVVTANDANGSYAEKEMTVTYNSGQ